MKTFEEIRFFDSRFKNNNFHYPFDISDEVREELFEIFVDYLRNNKERKTKSKLIDLCGDIRRANEIMFTFNIYYELFYTERNGIIYGTDYEGD